MARLIDDIRAGVLRLASEVNAPLDAILHSIVSEAVPVVAQNVVAAVTDSLDGGEWLPWRNFPSMRAPFPITWLEWDLYAESRDLGPGLRIGMLYTEEDGPVGPDGAPCTTDAVGGGKALVNYLGHALLFVHQRRTKSVYYVGQMHFTLNEQGRFIKPDIPVGYCNDIPPHLEDGESCVLGQMQVGLYAIGLMNCSNIGTVEVVPHPKVSKKREKKYGKPLVRYRVIQVVPHTVKKRTKTDPDQVSEGTALHLCRGHFKTFTKEGGGLGRYHITGTFWWRAQIRGEKKQGMVIHDYEVGQTGEAQ